MSKSDRFPEIHPNMSKPETTNPGPSSQGGAGNTLTPADSKKGGKILSVKVHMLDDQIIAFSVPQKAFGQVLFDQVYKYLNLLESDYFGMEYAESGGIKGWLDPAKPLLRQVNHCQSDSIFKFSVKFYTPDPGQLEEEYTRYLFALQIKHDLATSALSCNENTTALLASYILQAEYGDYEGDKCADLSYLDAFKFISLRNEEIQKKVVENHKKHVGQSPAEADLNLLETARRCELYGISMHPAKDHEGVALNLAVAHMGVLVFQNLTKINTFSWAKIRKLSFKRKRFLIKLHPEGYGYYKDTVEFYFESRNECKNFWKKCIEHHGFFRCATVKRLPRPKARVFSKGSSFRYSGRTQKEIMEYVRENYLKRQPFTRTASSRVSGQTSVGTSLAATPLLPLASDTRFSTSASRSSGSQPIASSHENMICTEMAEVSVHDGSSNSETRTLELGRSREMTPINPKAPSSPVANGMLQEENAEMYQEEEEASPTTTTNPLLITNEASKDEPMEQQGSLASTPLTPEEYPISLIMEPLSPITLVTIRTNENTSPSLKRVSTPSPALAPIHALSSDKLANATKVDSDEIRRKRYPTDKAFFIAKEILMTERTYKKDLEVITVWFHDEVNREEGMPDEVLRLLFQLLDPIYEFHCTFLKELEQRLAMWEGRSNAHLKGDYQKIGDIMVKNLHILKMYKNYIEKHYEVVKELEFATRRNKKFEQVYKDFEMQKVCYLPVTCFLLRPVQRLLHYKLSLERLVKHYNKDHPDYQDCQEALVKMKAVTDNMKDILRTSENFVKLVELQKDLTGIDNLVQTGREFIREGCLQKLSRRGYQQRMFFLFSDMLLYTNRTSSLALQFRVHGQITLRGMMVEETDPKMGVCNCFTIYGGNRALMVAAGSQEDKDNWIGDLTEAISKAKERVDDKIHYASLRSCSSSDEVLDKPDVSRSEEELPSPKSPSDKHTQHRSNTTVHVCWHRNTSVSLNDNSLAVENQLSGYLLRKFKNSNGWQKLWVVFTNFCLFFYKTFQDDFPLASLPLLGYVVSTPSDQDNIHKDYVFKLQFKSHVYFFRAESEYTFSRWMEVIRIATHHSAITPSSVSVTQKEITRL